MAQILLKVAKKLFKVAKIFMEHYQCALTEFKFYQGTLAIGLYLLYILFGLAAMLMLNEQQFYLSRQIQTSQTGGQPIVILPPMAIVL